MRARPHGASLFHISINAAIFQSEKNLAIPAKTHGVEILKMSVTFDSIASLSTYQIVTYLLVT
jgi:hypothetical protein